MRVTTSGSTVQVLDLTVPATPVVLRTRTLTPGVLALAVLSVAFVRVAIALGFDRSFGAIHRFAVTPLRPAEFIAAKTLATMVVFCLQLVVLGGVGLVLGWGPSVGPFVPITLLLGIVAFSGLGFVVGSIVEGLTSLALANTLYVVLLVLSGLVFDLDSLPGWLAGAVKVLPSTALAELLRAGFDGEVGPGWAWLGLAFWAVASPLVALRLFRWE